MLLGVGVLIIRFRSRRPEVGGQRSEDQNYSRPCVGWDEPQSSRRTRRPRRVSRMCVGGFDGALRCVWSDVKPIRLLGQPPLFTNFRSCSAKLQQAFRGLVARSFSERLEDWGGGPEISPNTESQRKGTFAEAARYVITRPQLPRFISSVNISEKAAALKPLPSPFYYAVTSNYAYGRTANGAVQCRIFRIDPPRWRIFLSVGKRLKKNDSMALTWPQAMSLSNGEAREGECPHEPCCMSRTPRQDRGARLNGDRAIRERRRHVNTESQQKGTFAEAARYVVMQPWRFKKWHYASYSVGCHCTIQQTPWPLRSNRFRLHSIMP